MENPPVVVYGNFLDIVNKIKASAKRQCLTTRTMLATSASSNIQSDTSTGSASQPSFSPINLQGGTIDKTNKEKKKIIETYIKIYIK